MVFFHFYWGRELDRGSACEKSELKQQPGRSVPRGFCLPTKAASGAPPLKQEWSVSAVGQSAKAQQQLATW